MSENQSRTASDDLYDHEREESRSGRRRRPVADWGVGEDMFEHLPRNRFSRAAEGPPRERRFSSHAADADRHAAGEAGPRARASDADPDAAAGRRRPSDADPDAAAERRRPSDADPGGAAGRHRPSDADPDAVSRSFDVEDLETGGDDDLSARREERRRRDEELSARDDSQRAIPEEPRRWTGPNRDEDDVQADEAPPRARRLDAPAPPEDVPRGGVADGRRTIVIGKPEDVPSEIAAITADRDIDDDTPPEADVAPRERRTVRIGGRPEGSLEAARFHRDHSRRRPARRPHERVGARPDRIAMWAFALGLLLIVIAILSAH